MAIEISAMWLTYSNCLSKKKNCSGTQFTETDIIILFTTTERNKRIFSYFSLRGISKIENTYIKYSNTLWQTTNSSTSKGLGLAGKIRKYVCTVTNTLDGGGRRIQVMASEAGQTNIIIISITIWNPKVKLDQYKIFKLINSLPIFENICLQIEKFLCSGKFSAIR